jgi:hypothetical protein
MASAIPVTLNAVNKAALDDYIQDKTYKVYLSTDAVVSADDNISDLTEIAPGSGYSAGGVSVAATAHQDGSAAFLTIPQVTIEASGGDIGPYTGIAIYNEVAPVTILDTTEKIIQFNQETGVLHWGSVVP